MEQKGVAVQTFCQQCEDAACIAACPVAAIAKNGSSGTIEIDHELCTLCEACVTACPFNGINLDDKDGKIIACDLCGGTPHCAEYCETKAIVFSEKTPVTLQKKKDSLLELGEFLRRTREY